MEGPLLDWDRVEVGMVVGVGSAVDLRRALIGDFGGSDVGLDEPDIERVAAVFGGQRCLVKKKAKSALALIEAAGRVECALFGGGGVEDRDGVASALIPAGLLTLDLQYLRVQRERHLAFAAAAETVQTAWCERAEREAERKREAEKEARRLAEQPPPPPPPEVAATRLQKMWRGQSARLAVYELIPSDDEEEMEEKEGDAPVDEEGAKPRRPSLQRRASEMRRSQAEKARWAKVRDEEARALAEAARAEAEQAAALEAADRARAEAEEAAHRARQVLRMQAVWRMAVARSTVVPLIKKTRAVERDLDAHAKAALKEAVLQRPHHHHPAASPGGGGPPSMMDDQEEDALALAFARVVQDRHLDVDVALEEDGTTAFLVACLAGRLGAAKFLFERGADADRRTKAPGWTPLHRAGLRGHTSVVKWLGATSPARLRATNDRGSTLAHAAVPPGRLDVLHFIKKTDLSLLCTANHDLDTPLHFAVVCAKPDLVHFLLQHAPSTLDAMNKNGLTPATLAERNGEFDLIDIFRRAAERVGRHLSEEGDDDDSAAAPTPAPPRAPPLQRQRPPKKKPPAKKKKRAPRPAAEQRNKEEKNATPTSGSSRRPSDGKEPSGMRMTAVDESDDDDDDCGDPWKRRDRRAAAYWASPRCTTLRAALPCAWKAASDDVCQRVLLRRDDVAMTLQALGTLPADHHHHQQQKQQQEQEEIDPFDDGFPASSSPPRKDDRALATVELAAGAAATASLNAAAAQFGLATTRAVAVAEAKIAQRRLLEHIRGPPAALKWIAERATAKHKPPLRGAFYEDDLTTLLAHCDAPRDLVDIGDVVNLTSLNNWLRNPASVAPPDDDNEHGPATATATTTELSALLYARCRFHVALVLRLAQWDKARNPAAGDGADDHDDHDNDDKGPPPPLSVVNAEAPRRVASGSGANSAVMLQRLASDDLVIQDLSPRPAPDEDPVAAGNEARPPPSKQPPTVGTLIPDDENYSDDDDGGGGPPAAPQSNPFFPDIDD